MNVRSETIRWWLSPDDNMTSIEDQEPQVRLGFLLRASHSHVPTEGEDTGSWSSILTCGHLGERDRGSEGDCVQRLPG